MTTRIPLAVNCLSIFATSRFLNYYKTSYRKGGKVMEWIQDERWWRAGFQCSLVRYVSVTDCMAARKRIRRCDGATEYNMYERKYEPN